MSVAGQTAIKAAMGLAGEVAEGRLAPAAFDAEAVEACRDLFVRPAEPGDPLWDVHGEVCRQHLAAGGLAASELAEWAAVARSRERALPGLSATLGDETGHTAVVTPMGFTDTAEADTDGGASDSPAAATTDASATD